MAVLTSQKELTVYEKKVSIASAMHSVIVLLTCFRSSLSVCSDQFMFLILLFSFFFLESMKLINGTNILSLLGNK